MRGRVRTFDDRAARPCNPSRSCYIDCTIQCEWVCWMVARTVILSAVGVCAYQVRTAYTPRFGGQNHPRRPPQPNLPVWQLATVPRHGTLQATCPRRSDYGEVMVGGAKGHERCRCRGTWGGGAAGAPQARWPGNLRAGWLRRVSLRSASPRRRENGALETCLPVGWLPSHRMSSFSRWLRSNSLRMELPNPSHARLRSACPARYRGEIPVRDAVGSNQGAIWGYSKPPDASASRALAHTRKPAVSARDVRAPTLKAPAHSGTERSGAEERAEPR